jgi:hypothetical protein
MSKFEKGKSGNPDGRPHGITDKRSELLGLLKPHAPALIQKVVDLALDGDTNALRLCMERLIPKAKDETINLVIKADDFTKPELLLNINSLVINAVSKGELTPEEGKTITGIVEAQRKLVETTNLNGRISALEQVMTERGKNYER